jgi:DedD protein
MEETMAESGTPESEQELRKRATTRLVVAGALVALAVGGLLLLDRRQPPSRMAEQPPASIVPALPSPGVAPAAEPPPGSEEQAPPPPPTASASSPPGPERVPGLHMEEKPHPAASAPVPVNAPVASSPPPPPAATTPKDFVVQLGVFSDPANALALTHRLAKAGIAAHTETRVQLGPFKSRVEAEQAAAKLKGMGLSPVITPR